MSKNRDKTGDAPVNAAQATSLEEAGALASANLTATPQGDEGVLVESTAHLTLPAVSHNPNVDTHGNINPDSDEAKLYAMRRAWLTHPNPPDDMVVDLDGTTVGDMRRRNAEARAGALTRDQSAQAATTVKREVLTEFKPDALTEDDDRSVQIVRETVTRGGQEFTTESVVTVAPPPAEPPVAESGVAVNSQTDPSPSAPVASSTPASTTGSSSGANAGTTDNTATSSTGTTGESA